MRISIIVSTILLISLTGCESESNPISTNSGVLPVVSGQYSFDTGPVSVSCDDGSTATNPPINLSFDVAQSENLINLQNAIPSGGIQGITIIETTGASGRVETNSDFIITQSSTATFAGVTDTISLNYSITGNFTSDGWLGTYTFAASSSIFGFCRFTAQFNGTKIIIKSGTKTPGLLLNAENLPVDIYDTFAVIGSSFAYE